MMLLRLAYASLRYRRFTAALCVFSLTLSVFVLLSVEFVRQETKASFGRTLSGTDLIVGARAGELNLLLYSVFRIGDPTNNLRWETYETIASNALVQWSIPLSLGDSHRGFRVLGTNQDYFKYYRYGDNELLRPIDGATRLVKGGAVIGATVAEKLNYQLGDNIVLSHGTGGRSFQSHDAHPFSIVGILERTGTPIDETVHVSLNDIDLIHSGVRDANAAESSRTITAFMLGLKSRMYAFRLQREIMEFHGEPLTAIMPSVALSKLWRMVSSLEGVLQIISALVLLSSLSGMSAMLLATLRERRQEFAVLRTVGASPSMIFALVEIEVLILSALGFLMGTSLVVLVSATIKGHLQTEYGLLLPIYRPDIYSAQLALLVLMFAAFCGLLPAIMAYRVGRGGGRVASA
jgi:putative ABC transport system permease protein